MFNPYSAFHQSGKQETLPMDVVGVIPADDQEVNDKDCIQVPTKQIDDWIHRLTTFSYEAGDESLFALESDILDMREELVRLLH